MTHLARLLVFAAVLAAVAGYGYVQGVSRESDRRDALELAQRKADDAERAVFAAFGQKKAGEALAARRRAAGYYRSLQEAIAHAQPQTLAQADCPPAAASSALGMPAARAVDLVLTGEFVRLYNAAWAAAGSSVPADPGGAAAAPAGAAGADPQEVLAHTAAEAQSCGDDRRRQLKLIELLTAAPGSP